MPQNERTNDLAWSSLVNFKCRFMWGFFYCFTLHAFLFIWVCLILFSKSCVWKKIMPWNETKVRSGPPEWNFISVLGISLQEARLIVIWQAGKRNVSVTWFVCIGPCKIFRLNAELLYSDSCTTGFQYYKITFVSIKTLRTKALLSRDTVSCQFEMTRERWEKMWKKTSKHKMVIFMLFCMLVSCVEPCGAENVTLTC